MGEVPQDRVASAFSTPVAIPKCRRAQGARGGVLLPAEGPDASSGGKRSGRCLPEGVRRGARRLLGVAAGRGRADSNRRGAR
eukprot:1566497-Pleurochrysis_carterae.AAC.4